MYIIQHLAVNLVLSTLVWFFTDNPYMTILFIAVGSLVDVDHYIYYVIKKRNLNPIKSYNYFYESCRMNVPLVFHSIEFMAIMLIATALTGNVYLLIASVAVIVHMVCDSVSDWKLIGDFRRFRLIK